MGGRSGQSINQGGKSTSEKIDNLVSQSATDAAKIHNGDVAGYDRYVYRDMDAQAISDRRSTEELKRDVGAFISTERVYGKPPAEMPREVRNHINDLGKERHDALIRREATQTVRISDINVTQQFVFEKPLKAAIRANKDKVVLFRYQGKLFLNDGNHRVAARKLTGKKTMNAVIIDVD
jgi:hypothetical protein